MLAVLKPSRTNHAACEASEFAIKKLYKISQGTFIFAEFTFSKQGSTLNQTDGEGIGCLCWKTQSGNALNALYRVYGIMIYHFTIWGHYTECTNEAKRRVQFCCLAATFPDWPALPSPPLPRPHHTLLGFPPKYLEKLVTDLTHPLTSASPFLLQHPE